MMKHDDEYRNNLRILRKNKKLTVEEVAEILDISVSYYYELEKATKRLNEDLLNKIADYYQCTTDYILKRVEEPNLAIIDKDSLSDEIREMFEFIVAIRGYKITPEMEKELLLIAKKTKGS